MAEKPKGDSVPETEEREKSGWTIDIPNGRFTLKHPSGKTTSVVMSWWGELPAQFREVVILGVTTRVKNTAISREKFTPAEQEVERTALLHEIADGNLGTGPMLRDIYECMVAMGVAKKAEEAQTVWAKSTDEKRNTFLESSKFAQALKWLRADRVAKREAAAFKAAKADDIPEL